jgi:hypothetical protein
VKISFPYFKKTLALIRTKGLTDKNLTNTKSGPPPPFSKILRSSQWPELKEKFLSWQFGTLSDLARYLGLRPDHRGLRKATAGWNAERGKIKPVVMSKTLETLATERAGNIVRDLYSDALAAHYKLLHMVTDTVDKCYSRWKDPDRTPWHTQAAAQAVMDLAKAMSQLLPAIRGLESLKVIHQIFDELLENRTDIVKASLALARLGVAMPKSIEILLTKHKADELPPDDGEVISDEAIVARRAEIMAEIEAERAVFVPERKRLVAQMKAEISDSFKAQRVAKNT